MERTLAVRTYIFVKMMFLLSLGVIAATAIVGLRGNGRIGSPVGTRPGDIGTSPDTVASAKSRGHELAVFAAG